MAEFAMARRRDPAAQQIGHQLHAVADAKHRRADLEHPGVAAGRARLRHALRAAGQDDADRAAPCEFGRRRVERQDLAVDGELAKPARDQLGELRAEIENQDGLMGQVGDP
jgi:hypothetical protein